MYRHVYGYDHFLNENKITKYIKKIVHSITNIFGEDPQEIIEILTKLKTQIVSKIETISKKDIEKMSSYIESNLDKDVILKLNLDLFFKGLSNIILLRNKSKVEKYFNKYIEDLPNRIKNYTDIHEYEEDELPQFKELKKLKRKIKFKIDKTTYVNELIPLKLELLKMQEWLKKSGKSLAICFDGRDAAGKGACISTISSDLDPKYYKVSVFGIPTDEEQNNWFERYKKRLPKPGKMTLYDRSWWNRGCNDPVMGYCSEEQYEQFMKDVVKFEEDIVDNNTYLIKFWFSVSKEIQKLRFEMLQKDPLHYWKFSENDLKTMNKWDRFTAYKERMFYESSKTNNPFVVVVSEDKRLAQLNAIRYILKQIPYEGKNLEIVDKIRQEIIIPISKN